MGKADLHAHSCHDSWGDGNQSVEELFRWVEERTDLDIFAITDHDSVDAAVAAREIHRRGAYRFSFLPGVEVTNRAGHLLCYFPDGDIQPVPSLRPFWTTVRLAQSRGAICVVAHPIYPPWLAGVIERGLASGNRLDGIEASNAGLSSAAQIRLGAVAGRFSDRVALVASSDAHEQTAIGSAYTEFPGHSVQEFLVALAGRETRPVYLRQPIMTRRARRFTTMRSMTRPGWVRNLYRELRDI
ncbi:MAG: PHP-associated domain-containing protein [Chloroflexota bacterium]